LLFEPTATLTLFFVFDVFMTAPFISEPAKAKVELNKRHVIAIKIVFWIFFIFTSLLALKTFVQLLQRF